eukprot:418347_1
MIDQYMFLSKLSAQTYKTFSIQTMTQIQDETPLQAETKDTEQQIQPITEDADAEIEMQPGAAEPHGEQQAVDFGSSEDYGQRLDYKKKKCRNPICFIIYYLHVFTLIGFTVYLLAYAIPDHQDKNNSNPSNNNNIIHLHTNQFNNFNLAENNNNANTNANNNDEEFSYTGVAVAILTATGFSIIFSFIWLQILNWCAGPIIKLMLILNILVWVALFIVGCIYINWWLIIFAAIFVIIFTLWSWCVWDKVRFAVVLMGIATSIIQNYQGVIWLSIGVVAFDLVWIFLWSVCTYAYFWYIVEANIRFSFWIFIFLLISLFWGNAVNMNISHTTTCGVAATWYFSSGVNILPTFPAFWRTMTTSFGSIAFGSFFVGLLEAIRSMFKWCENNRYSCIRCIVRCWLSCINWLIIYFNKYAYAHVAIYGSGFIHAAQQTWNLFMNKGIMAIINDDLTGAAITCGALVCGVLSGGIGWGIGYAFYKDSLEDEWAKYGLLTCIAIFSGIVGLIMMQICLHPLPSAVQCLFVCWAEEPEVLAENRPKAHKALMEVCKQHEKTVPTENYPAAH